MYDDVLLGPQASQPHSFSLRHGFLIHLSQATAVCHLYVPAQLPTIVGIAAAGQFACKMTDFQLLLLRLLRRHVPRVLLLLVMLQLQSGCKSRLHRCKGCKL